MHDTIVKDGDVWQFAEWMFKQPPTKGNTYVTFDLGDRDGDVEALFECLLIVFSVGVISLFGQPFNIKSQEDIRDIKMLMEAGHPTWNMLVLYFKNFLKVYPCIIWSDDDMGLKLYFENT